MTDRTRLGDRMKQLEAAGTSTVFEPHLPVVIRLDGRGFSRLTKKAGCEKPFDADLAAEMDALTRILADEVAASWAYTQSDEISLILPPRKAEHPFGGRLFKLCSVLASIAGSARVLGGGQFDCRAYSVPKEGDAVSALIWRERDARRNAVQGAARSIWSHRECLGKNGRELEGMLAAAGRPLSSFPDRFTAGLRLQRVRVSRRFTADEIDRLPAKHAARRDPSLTIERSELAVFGGGWLASLGAGAADAVFRGGRHD